LVFKIFFRLELVIEIHVFAIHSHIFYSMIHYDMCSEYNYIILLYLYSTVIDDDVALVPSHVQVAFLLLSKIMRQRQ